MVGERGSGAERSAWRIAAGAQRPPPIRGRKPAALAANARLPLVTSARFAQRNGRGREGEGADRQPVEYSKWRVGHGGFPLADWLTLGQALEQRLLSVSEVSRSGSVPELIVTNRADRPVLLLDGEELVGAKQNRVFNTTILLKEQWEKVVPVICTEQGRWAYISAAVADAKVVMASKIPVQKMMAVSESLAASEGFKSDQGEVWAEIDALHAKAGTSSPTGAMHDRPCGKRDPGDCPVVYLTASLTCKYLELPEIPSRCNQHPISSVGQILLLELCLVTPSPSVIQTPGSTLSGSIVFFPIHPPLKPWRGNIAIYSRGGVDLYECELDSLNRG